MAMVKGGKNKTNGVLKQRWETSWWYMWLGLRQLKSRIKKKNKEKKASEFIIVIAQRGHTLIAITNRHCSYRCALLALRSFSESYRYKFEGKKKEEN